MSAKWPMVKLGAVLRQRKQFITIDDASSYKRPRVQLHAKGIVLRDEVPGATIKTKSQQVCQAGEFLVAEIDAKAGGFGIVPESLQGAIVSSHYFLFAHDESKLSSRFLDYFIRTPGFREQVAAQGTTNYAAIRAGQVLDYQIPLPPLAEQKRVAGRIEELAGQVGEAQRLRQQAQEGSQSLLRSMLSSDKNEEVAMRSLVRQRPPDVIVKPDANYSFAGVYCFGRGLFRSVTKSGMEFAYQRLTQIKAGEFLYPKLMAWEGAFGIVPPECDGLFVSPEFPVFEIDQSRVLPDILDVYFRTPSIWPLLTGASTGTNARRRRLNPQDFLSYKMPLPSQKAQEAFRHVKKAMDQLMPLQRQTATELDALLPAILSKAFKGEL